MDSTVIIFVIVAILIGLGVGWFLGSRGAAPLRDELAALRERAGAAERESASAGERAARSEQLQTLLNAVTGERDEAIRAHAALQADARNFDARMKDLTESKDALIAQFRVIGDQLLEKAHKDFLEKAGERFTAADKASETKLRTLLAPVETTLKRYEEGLAKVEKERVDHYAGLREAVELVRTGQGQVRDEARNLVNALRSSPKQRGRWGEQSLKNVLEQAGLSQHADFRTEVSVDTDDGRLRPDVIVRLPGGRSLVIDAKCSLNAFLDAESEVDDLRKKTHLKAHSTAFRNHVKSLASKDYWNQFEGSADYVVMFVPGEHFVSAALEDDQDLFDWALSKRVLIASQVNLIAIARTAAIHWEQSQRNDWAEELTSIARELHLRFATAFEHLRLITVNLESLNKNYNKFVGSLETKIMPQMDRFERLGARSHKLIPHPESIETTPKALTKLALPHEPSANEDDAAA